jgi:hypothetical protein
MEIIKYLSKEEIFEHSIIMIDLTNGNTKPYYVWKKENGKVIGSIIYLGELLENLIIAPYWYPLRHKTTERFYAMGEPNKLNIEVLGYRKMTEDEKKEWAKKLAPIPGLKDLFDILNI